MVIHKVKYMLDRNMFVIELDESTQATIKEMVTSALEDLGVYEYEMVESAMSGKLYDLEDLIDLGEISKNEISDIYSNENLVNEFIKVLDMDSLDLINDKQALFEMVNNKNEMIYNLIQMVLELQENL